MYLIVGLGNPGDKYKLTRHNAGFMFCDSLATKLKSEFQSSKYVQADISQIGGTLLIAKPQTFMNDSGTALKLLVDKYKFNPEEIHVVHDDLDLPLGQIKIQQGIGPKIHNGILDIEEKLKLKNFWRVRIGVDNRDPENRVAGERYVLADFTLEELEILKTSLNEEVDKLAAMFGSQT